MNDCNLLPYLMAKNFIGVFKNFGGGAIARVCPLVVGLGPMKAGLLAFSVFTCVCQIKIKARYQFIRVCRVAVLDRKLILYLAKLKYKFRLQPALCANTHSSATKVSFRLSKTLMLDKRVHAQKLAYTLNLNPGSLFYIQVLNT